MALCLCRSLLESVSDGHVHSILTSLYFLVLVPGATIAAIETERSPMLRLGKTNNSEGEKSRAGSGFISTGWARLEERSNLDEVCISIRSLLRIARKAWPTGKIRNV